MPERNKHCGFWQDNGRGRCIADCIHAKDGTDCIGRSDPTMDSIRHHEIQVSCGFIDGRGKAVDAKGYPIVQPKIVSLPPTAKPEKQEEFTDANGWTYVWDTTPGGMKYKRYVNFNDPKVTP